MGYQYIFDCKQINMFIEWISGDLIFIGGHSKQSLKHFAVLSFKNFKVLAYEQMLT